MTETVDGEKVPEEVLTGWEIDSGQCGWTADHGTHANWTVHNHEGKAVGMPKIGPPESPSALHPRREPFPKSSPQGYRSTFQPGPSGPASHFHIIQTLIADELPAISTDRRNNPHGD